MVQLSRWTKACWVQMQALWITKPIQILSLASMNTQFNQQSDTHHQTLLRRRKSMVCRQHHQFQSKDWTHSSCRIATMVFATTQQSTQTPPETTQLALPSMKTLRSSIRLTMRSMAQTSMAMPARCRCEWRAIIYHFSTSWSIDCQNTKHHESILGTAASIHRIKSQSRILLNRAYRSSRNSITFHSLHQSRLREQKQRRQGDQMLLLRQLLRLDGRTRTWRQSGKRHEIQSFHRRASMVDQKLFMSRQKNLSDRQFHHRLNHMQDQSLKLSSRRTSTMPYRQVIF